MDAGRWCGLSAPPTPRRASRLAVPGTGREPQGGSMRRRRHDDGVPTRRASLGVLAPRAPLVRPAAAQPDCSPPDPSHGARTMAIFDVPLAFSGAAAPARRPAGGVTVGLEVTYLPWRGRATAP